MARLQQSFPWLSSFFQLFFVLLNFFIDTIDVFFQFFHIIFLALIVIWHASWIILWFLIIVIPTHFRLRLWFLGRAVAHRRWQNCWAALEAIVGLLLLFVNFSGRFLYFLSSSLGYACGLIWRFDSRFVLCSLGVTALPDGWCKAFLFFRIWRWFVWRLTWRIAVWGFLAWWWTWFGNAFVFTFAFFRTFGAFRRLVFILVLSFLFFIFLALRLSFIRLLWLGLTLWIPICLRPSLINLIKHFFFIG